MKENGRVVALEADDALVLFRRTSMCAKCGACGMGSSQSDITVRVPNDLGAEIGDEVQVQFQSRSALASSAIGYMFPLLMLFLGMWAGYMIPPVGGLIPDAMAAICGLLCAALAFVILKLLDPVFQKRLANVYTMTEIVSREAG
ncbi:MAG: SoxR reducing system RseC family protein [Clostridia bacterium]|nr:SoxR reducing system RseC family protein [Clostridia bacterium]